MPDELKFEDTPGPGHPSTKLGANKGIGSDYASEGKGRTRDTETDTSGSLIGDLANRMINGPSIFSTPMYSKDKKR